MSSKELWWSRKKKDFRIDWFSGSGAGGQHRNRHQNCCRMTDLETGIVTTGQETRSRTQNLKLAFRRMIKRLMQHYMNFTKSDDLPPGLNDSVKAGFGHKTTRSYDLESDRVTDHVTGEKYSYRHTVGANDIGKLVEDRKKFLDEQRLKDL